MARSGRAGAAAVQAAGRAPVWVGPCLAASAAGLRIIASCFPPRQACKAYSERGRSFAEAVCAAAAACTAQTSGFAAAGRPPLAS